MGKGHNRGVLIIGSAAKHPVGPCGPFIECAAAPHHIVFGFGHHMRDRTANALGVFIGHDIAVGRFMLPIQKSRQRGCAAGHTRLSCHILNPRSARPNFTIITQPLKILRSGPDSSVCHAKFRFFVGSDNLFKIRLNSSHSAAVTRCIKSS